MIDPTDGATWWGPILAPALGRVLFGEAELRCRATHMVRLDHRFALLLRDLRLAFGRPMKVTSCCRSSAHNANVGGHKRSLHVYDAVRAHQAVAGTAAIDIACPDPAYAWLLVHKAQELGWSIGVKQIAGGPMVHLDRRDLAGLRPGVFGY